MPSVCFGTYPLDCGVDRNADVTSVVAAPQTGPLVRRTHSGLRCHLVDPPLPRRVPVQGRRGWLTRWTALALNPSVACPSPRRLGSDQIVVHPILLLFFFMKMNMGWITRTAATSCRAGETCKIPCLVTKDSFVYRLVQCIVC